MNDAEREAREHMRRIINGEIPEINISIGYEKSETEKEQEEKDLRICPKCSREVQRQEMNFTRDCHGIPFRLLCFGCYEKAMSKGYDGEYYTEADEQIEDDY